MSRIYLVNPLSVVVNDFVPSHSLLVDSDSAFSLKELHEQLDFADIYNSSADFVKDIILTAEMAANPCDIIV